MGSLPGRRPRSGAFQQLKDRRDVTSSDGLAPVFKLLTDHGYVCPMDLIGQRQGRPGPTPEVYAVNRFGYEPLRRSPPNLHRSAGVDR
jgi:hypothetical protein